MPANILKQNYQYQNLILKGGILETGTFYNNTGSAVVLTPGVLLGRNTSTGNLQVMASGSNDGSLFPRGVVSDTYPSVANGASITVNYWVKGEINQNVLQFNGTDTLNTIVGAEGSQGSTYADLINALTQLVLFPSIELSNYDN